MFFSRIRLTLFICTLCICANAQTFKPVIMDIHTAYDTNGPIGECLFPLNDTLVSIIECDKDKKSIKEDISSYFTLLQAESGKEIEISNYKSTESVIIADIQLFNGKTMIELPWVGFVEKHYSELKFHLHIDFKDNKYRVMCTNFNTERITIHGDGKSDGPSNRLHWQRVNSLTKERDKARKTSKKEEITSRIKQEEDIYKQEYASFKNFLNKLEHHSDEPDF